MNESHYIKAELICRKAYEERFNLNILEDEGKYIITDAREQKQFLMDVIKLFNEIKPDFPYDIDELTRNDPEKFYDMIALSVLCGRHILHNYKCLKELEKKE